MNTRAAAITAYRALLRLFPAGFRAEFEEEMVAVFAARLEATGTVAAALGLLLREVAGLAAGGLRARLYARTTRPALLAGAGGGQVAVDRRPWMRRITLLMVAAAVVLLGLGALFAFLTRQSFWDGDMATHAAVLADFDGDGDLDLVLANDEYLGTVPDPVWWNDGQGRFTDSGTRLDEYYPNSFRVATGDFNGDGREDILFGVAGSGWLILNEGAGQFSPGRLIPAHELTIGPVIVAPGDLDGDGDLDALIAVCCGTLSQGDGAGMYFPPRHRAFLNDGAGRLTAVPGSLGEYGTRSVALGDLDGDGDLDAFLGNSFSRSSDEPDTIWLNDGAGRFSDTGQRLRRVGTNAVALGDLDGDGDLDVFTGRDGPSEVWFNDGVAVFSDSGQQLAGEYTRFVFLSDLDGDGDLDALVEASRPRGRGREGLVQVWINDGAGGFAPGEAVLTYPDDCAAVPGDVDGDGDIDIVAGCVEREVRVWLNDGAGRFTRK